MYLHLSILTNIFVPNGLHVDIKARPDSANSTTAHSSVNRATLLSTPAPGTLSACCGRKRRLTLSQQAAMPVLSAASRRHWGQDNPPQLWVSTTERVLNQLSASSCSRTLSTSCMCPIVVVGTTDRRCKVPPSTRQPPCPHSQRSRVGSYKTSIASSFLVTSIEHNTTTMYIQQHSFGPSMSALTARAPAPCAYHPPRGLSVIRSCAPSQHAKLSPARASRLSSSTYRCHTRLSSSHRAVSISHVQQHRNTQF